MGVSVDDTDQVRQMCDAANRMYGTDLEYVGSVGAEHIIESATKRYTGHGDLELLQHMIAGFAGGWLAAQAAETRRRIESSAMTPNEERRMLGGDGDVPGLSAQR